MVLFLVSYVVADGIFRRFGDGKGSVFGLPAECTVVIFVYPSGGIALKKVDHFSDGMCGIEGDVEVDVVGHAAGEEEFAADVIAYAGNVGVEIVTPVGTNGGSASVGGPDEVVADVNEGGHAISQ